MDGFATSIFPSTAGTDVISTLTTTLSDNIAVVITLLAFFVGIRLAVKMFSGAATKGKIKV